MKGHGKTEEIAVFLAIDLHERDTVSEEEEDNQYSESTVK
jgi:hypothetical protein